MVDSARALLDELMGRNRDLDESDRAKKPSWEDPKFCEYFLVKLCPHEVFFNTKTDLGLCRKIHDEEAKRLYETAEPSRQKRKYAENFLCFCDELLDDVDRKIQRGKERIIAMGTSSSGYTYVSKFQEQLNNMNGRIRKLMQEAEEAGLRGDVDQAKDLTVVCEQLNDEKEQLIQLHGMSNKSLELAGAEQPLNSSNIQGQEKQMNVCEVCGAFLLVGDIQQRLENHLSGRQHLGYTKLRKAVAEVRQALKQLHIEEMQEKSSKSKSKISLDKMKCSKENSLSKRGECIRKSDDKFPKRSLRREYRQVRSYSRF